MHKVHKKCINIREFCKYLYIKFICMKWARIHINMHKVCKNWYTYIYIYIYIRMKYVAIHINMHDVHLNLTKCHINAYTYA